MLIDGLRKDFNLATFLWLPLWLLALRNGLNFEFSTHGWMHRTVFLVSFIACFHAGFSCVSNRGPFLFGDSISCSVGCRGFGRDGFKRRSEFSKKMRGIAFTRLFFPLAPAHVRIKCLLLIVGGIHTWFC